ncbi:MAG: hypothetical protein KKF46_08760 [Nanoarchaeota archaeon]|nr:hypothetical protein [Nanoarchaeota archaeon]MBU1322421.1 hypothetical protein [Nanoarchaeota archaeon]MBU1598170.1 hypothetical protein [Nanoarchaeota archaeon]MBU2441423.1 hypothetical protein [Nanoarchaeota archaeon]
MRKKAQVATEFMIMIGLSMIIIMVLAGVLYVLTHDYSEQRNINRLTDLGYSLQNEIILASEVELGYERNISIPSEIEDLDYTITTLNNDIIITYRRTELLFPIPNITGTLQKGINTIRKTDISTVSIS